MGRGRRGKFRGRGRQGRSPGRTQERPQERTQGKPQEQQSPPMRGLRPGLLPPVKINAEQMRQAVAEATASHEPAKALDLRMKMIAGELLHRQKFYWRLSAPQKKTMEEMVHTYFRKRNKLGRSADQVWAEYLRKPPSEAQFRQWAQERLFEHPDHVELLKTAEMIRRFCEKTRISFTDRFHGFLRQVAIADRLVGKAGKTRPGT